MKLLTGDGDPAMNIQELAKLGQIVMPNNSSDTSQTDSSVFDAIYQTAVAKFDQTNQLQKNADEMSLNYALGKVDNVHDVMIAQEKASIALQYTVQIKNAVIDAYNELMRLQL